MHELISIIMPAFRAEAFIAEAVRSVLQQSMQNWELIIISDDGRDYQQLLREARLQGFDIEDERLRFTYTGAIQTGPNHARNVGLKLARGQWIAPLDADDIYYPQRLERLSAAANETGLALDNLVLAGEVKGYEPALLDLEDGAHFGFDEFKRSLAPLLFLFHRELITCGWDDDIARGADTLFNLRALELASYAVFQSQPLHEYRVHNNSLCHSEGAEKVFISAYDHTLARLNSDGLGFKTAAFRKKVIGLVEEKKRINHDFLQAVARGFTGNYQNFVQGVGS